MINDFLYYLACLLYIVKVKREKWLSVLWYWKYSLASRVCVHLPDGHPKQTPSCAPFENNGIPEASFFILNKQLGNDRGLNPSAESRLFFFVPSNWFITNRFFQRSYHITFLSIRKPIAFVESLPFLLSWPLKGTIGSLLDLISSVRFKHLPSRLLLLLENA